MLFAITGVLLLTEQLGGAVEPTKPGPSPVPPAIFSNVGPSVEEWEKYLRKISDDLDEQRTSEPIRQEDTLFSQVNRSLTWVFIALHHFTLPAEFKDFELRNPFN